jgi:hypothetical protein
VELDQDGLDAELRAVLREEVLAEHVEIELQRVLREVYGS